MLNFAATKFNDSAKTGGTFSSTASGYDSLYHISGQKKRLFLKEI